MNRILISPPAQSDLQDIKKYISIQLESPTAAINTTHKILKAIRSLSNFPQRGVPLASFIDISTDYRFLTSGNYLIFYRYEDKQVYILRVLYRKRDYLKILFGDLEE